VYRSYGVQEDLRAVKSDDNWSAALGIVILPLTRALFDGEQSPNQETYKVPTLIDGFQDDVNGFC
jgi:hypothetical protein